jgi:hypothetical protein
LPVGKRCGENKATQREDGKLIIRKYYRGRKRSGGGGLVDSGGSFKCFNSDLLTYLTVFFILRQHFSLPGADPRFKDVLP